MFSGNDNEKISLKKGLFLKPNNSEEYPRIFYK